MISEAQFQRQITDLADLYKWRWHHNADSRRAGAGWPDLVLVGHGRALFLELKSATGRVRDAQRIWLSALSDAGLEVALVRPDDLPMLVDVLGPRQRRLGPVFAV